MALAYSRTRTPIVLAAAAALVTTMTMMQPASAVPGDDLDVSFGGSLVGNTAYTTTEGEQMLGSLHRVVGTEEQIPGTGVVLGGGTDGLRFDASRIALGTSGALIAQSFVAEMVFTPAETEQVLQGTLFSAGGNMSVRYEGGQFTYGYDTNAVPPWAKYRQAVDAPTPGQEHTFSLHYIAHTDGTVTIDAMLDGELLPSVEGANSARIASGLQGAFGFGHEVHAGGTERGFIGSIKSVRVNATDGSADVFRYQGTEAPAGPFHVTWDGTLEDTYTATSYEVVDGGVDRVGTATTAGGNLILDGAGGVTFTGDPNALADDVLDGPGFVIETRFTPDGRQADGATLVSLGGDFRVAYVDGQISYGFGEFSEAIAAPVVGREAVLSVAWEPNTTGAGGRVVVWLDGVAGPEIQAADFIGQSVPGVVGFGTDVGGSGSGLVGSMSESRFGLLEGAFTNDAFKFQTLAPVEECAPDAPEVLPGNYQDVSVTDCSEFILAKAAALRPTQKQANWQEEGLTAFVHFGVNTFYNQEWGHGTEDPVRVDPTGDLDPEVWVKQLRDAGFRTVVITLKHHDGFMLWPTRYSDYDIAASPWQDGQGDIAGDVAEAARKYGMKVGFYLSPADSHAEIEGIYGNGSTRSERTIPTLVEGDDRAGDDSLPEFTYEATDYGEFFLNTLYEVLTQYGQVDEVWFDGAAGNTGATEVFDYDAYYDLIYALQPDANVAVGGRDIRWIGNEHGEARDNEWGPVPISDSGVGRIYTAQPGGVFNQNYGSDEQVVSVVQSGASNQLHWWPAEADMKITPGWFAHPGDVPKTPEALLGHYERTVGRNAVMLLNVPPTTTGQFADASVASIDGFAAERRKAFTLDHALGADATVAGETVTTLTNDNTRDGHTFAAGQWEPITIDLGEPKSVARVGLSEDILDAGMTVKEFIVEAEVDGTWTQVGSAGTIGAQRIVTLDAPVTAQQWRVTVIDARADYVISDVKLWGQLTTDPGKLSDVYLDCSAERAGDGSDQRPFNSLEQFRKTELATGATIHIRAGVDCAAADVVFWGYGTEADPLEVVSWGEGPAPTIGGEQIVDALAGYEQQGWSVLIEPDTEPTPTATPTPTPTPSPTDAPTAQPTATVTVTSPPPAKPQPRDVYNTPGFHKVNGREWFTSCEPYSQTVRCHTDIVATTVVVEDGRFVRRTGWTFNNLTYLPLMSRAQWAGNPLGHEATWVGSDGRSWRTECDTAVTGRNGCRSWVRADVVGATAAPVGGYTYSTSTQWVFNNIVRFK